MEPNQEHDIPAVDQIANGENLQMYKAMIPYFPKNMQRTLALLIKMAEMNHLLSFYNSPMSACAMPETHNPEEFFLSCGNMAMTDKTSRLIRSSI